MEHVVLLENNEYNGSVFIEEPIIFNVENSELFIKEQTKKAWEASQSKGMGLVKTTITIAGEEYSTFDFFIQGSTKGEYKTSLLTMEEFTAKLIEQSIKV